MGLRTALGLKKSKTLQLTQTSALATKERPLRDLSISIDDTEMEFTTNYSRKHFQKWNRALVDRKPHFNRILEIGSFEGRSANIFLQILPNSHITCIDRFDVPERSARFDKNLARHGDRVRKISGNSSGMLCDLIFDGDIFDVTYIDGSHSRANVYIDSLLCWEMLKPGATVIWDDYTWRQDLPLRDRPPQAIDRFIEAHKDELQVLLHGDQVIARRKL